MEAEVKLTPFSSSKIPQLRRWLAVPNVATWYPESEDHIGWAVNPPPCGEQALIAVDDRTVGYVRWQAVTREILDSVGLHDVPAGSVDVDILIGDPEFVGCGIGPKALRVLLSKLHQRGGIPWVGLTTNVQNLSAQRAFTKAGFHILRSYNPPGYGRCYLMVYCLNDSV